MDKGYLQTTPFNQSLHRKKRNLFAKIASYSLLLALFILLAGHESINPKIGESHVDFYLENSRRLLEISSKAVLLNDEKPVNLQQQLELLTNEFYRSRNFNPAWTLNFHGSDQLDSLISLIDSLSYFGIPSNFINSFQVTSLLDQLENHDFEENKIGQRISLEIEATQSAFLLMTMLNKGFVQVDTSREFTSYLTKLPALLNSSLTGGVQRGILDMQPNFPEYKALISVLPEYLMTQKKIKNANEVITKTELMSAFNFLGYMSGSFDSVQTLDAVVKEFQKNNNIKESGRINKTTIRRLSEVMDAQYYKIALNLDRLRKSSINSDEYLYVNIPEFKLYAYSENRKERDFVVVVGKRSTPTPTVSSTLKKIITNPYWTVPRSIAKYELLPKIREDSTFMARNRYFVIDWKEDVVDISELDWDSDDPFGKQFWLRQQYGGGNALGKVKFIFPNDYRVYLHDTPSKRLFKRDYRAYSHGCVRVQNPEKLAQYLSDKYVSTAEDSVNIDESIATRKRMEFVFNAQVDVHIQYITCKVKADGSIVFFNDVYRKDKKAIKELFGEMNSI